MQNLLEFLTRKLFACPSHGSWIKTCRINDECLRNFNTCTSSLALSVLPSFGRVTFKLDFVCDLMDIYQWKLLFWITWLNKMLITNKTSWSKVTVMSFRSPAFSCLIFSFFLFLPALNSSILFWPAQEAYYWWTPDLLLSSENSCYEPHLVKRQHTPYYCTKCILWFQCTNLGGDFQIPFRCLKILTHQVLLN